MTKNVNTIKCGKCNLFKPINEFHKDKSKKYGVRSICIICVKEYNIANIDRKKITDSIHYKNNIENHRIYNEKWSSLNKETKTKCELRWQAENPEKVAEYNRKSRHTRRALKEKEFGKLSIGLFDKLFKLQKGKCACCKTKLSNVKPRSPMDHIISLSKGGLNIDSNIQLLCQPCNNQKHAKDPIQFMQSKGFLC